MLARGTKMNNKFNMYALKELIICQVVGRTSKQTTIR